MTVCPYRVVWLSSGFIERTDGKRYQNYSVADAAGRAGMKGTDVGYYVKS